MNVASKTIRGQLRPWKLDLASALVMLIVASVVATMAFLSVAWFASNRNVGANSAMISIEDELFELSVVENLPLPAEGGGATQPPYLSILSLLRGRQYSNDALRTGADRTGVSAPLTVDGGGLLRPGSTGTFTFKIHPAAGASDLNIRFDLLISGIQRVPGENNGPATFRVVGDSDPQDSHGAEVCRFLKGHVLFFQEKAGGKYSGWVDPEQGLIYSLPDHSADDDGSYGVTLYWVWPRTYGQIALEDGDANLLGHSLFTDSQEVPAPDRVKLLERVENHPEEFFLYEGETAPSGLSERSDGYNGADQVIGEGINYVMVELKASPADRPVLPETPGGE